MSVQCFNLVQLHYTFMIEDILDQELLRLCF